MSDNLFMLIPKVDEVLRYNGVANALESIPRPLVLEAIREVTDNLREGLRNGQNEKWLERELLGLDESIVANARKKSEYSLKNVVNATGVVIHTNLGRSLIDPEIMKHISETAVRYSNLEYDLDKGTRGSRYSHLEDIVAKIVGSEAALVVNNNAAAVMLVLSTIAKGKEVVVSRGELIEIGGAFRVPEVMEQSGCTLVEVGTTNKTHLRDYENALTENTAAILKVHTSNYRIVGFTSDVDSEELTPLKREYGIPVIEDLGSGVMIDLSKYGITYEPTVSSSLKKGVDIVTFSGDKLLGGPQAGIIAGRRDLIEKMKKNPLTRALRVDKFTISALEATIRLYFEETTAVNRIPTLRMLTMTIEELEETAQEVLRAIEQEASSHTIKVYIEDDYSEVGGGSLPLEKLPTRVVVIDAGPDKASRIEESLRSYDIPVISRISKDRVLLDPRTVQSDETEIIRKAFKYAVDRL